MIMTLALHISASAGFYSEDFIDLQVCFYYNFTIR